MDLTDTLRAFAEAPERFAYVPEGGTIERFVDDRVCILQGKTWASVCGVNVAVEALDDLIDEVRGRVPPDKEPLWSVGSSSRPENLRDELLRRGFAPPGDRVGESRALALVVEPAGPDGIDVQPVETFEQYAAAQEVSWDAFAWSEEKKARNKALLKESFDEMMRFAIPATFVAYADGRPAGSAGAVPADPGVFLIGGSVAEWARGRGIYRALVRARWDYAVERGTPALVTHANLGTSYPILRRLGFEEVGALFRLEDQPAAN